MIEKAYYRQDIQRNTIAGARGHFSFTHGRPKRSGTEIAHNIRVHAQGPRPKSPTIFGLPSQLEQVRLPYPAPTDNSTSAQETLNHTKSLTIFGDRGTKPWKSINLPLADDHQTPIHTNDIGLPRAIERHVGPCHLLDVASPIFYCISPPHAGQLPRRLCLMSDFDLDLVRCVVSPNSLSLPAYRLSPLQGHMLRYACQGSLECFRALVPANSLSQSL